MGTLPKRAFHSLLGGLDGDAFVGFVASLWSARGYDIERDGDLLVATDGEEEAVVYPVPARFGGRWRPASRPDGVTTVVVGDRTVPHWARGNDVDVVDADDLYELVRYGVSTADRDAVFRRWFDRPAAARPADESPLPWLAHRLPERVHGPLEKAGMALPPANVVGTIVVVSLVVVAFLAGGVLLPFGGFPGGPAGTTTATSTTPTPTGVPIQPPTSPPSEEAGLTYPPGVDESGVTNVSRLLVAHVRAVDNTSYVLSVVYREVGDDHTGEAREVVYRSTRTRYVTDVERNGSFEAGHWPVADREVYTDGDRRYLRLFRNDSVRYRVTEPYSGWVGLLERRAGALLRTALEGADTRVVRRIERDGTDYYRIRFETPNGTHVERYGTTVRDADGVLLVSEYGIVQYLRWSFVRVDTGVSVVVELSYRVRGDVTVQPPPWLGEARNATG